MREVMKIAFRRENINVFAYHDANAALAEIEKTPPDVVITDVIMPNMSGFEVCQFIKRHPRLNKMPVVLLSGVVDPDVEQKAANVKADGLIRKPFQPQDLISRVRGILAAIPAPAAAPAPSPLSGIFSSAPGSARPALPALPSPVPSPRIPAPPPLSPSPGSSMDAPKLRLEVARLSSLVTKLRAELVGEREYARALEEHVRTLQEAE
jgi:CheY-like chemotaxis protein